MNVLPKELFSRESISLDYGHGGPRSTLSKSTIAATTAAAIERMNNDELTQFIHASQLPARLRPDFPTHLPTFDHATLLRLAFLARHLCRNQCIATPLTQLEDCGLASIPH